MQRLRWVTRKVDRWEILEFDDSQSWEIVVDVGYSVAEGCFNLVVGSSLTGD